MNYIGTDVTGTVALGNAANGILVTALSAGNTIGGQATGGNNPTKGTIVQPPQGNVISASYGAGVMITGGATQNQLSGNFIGTTTLGRCCVRQQRRRSRDQRRRWQFVNRLLLLARSVRVLQRHRRQSWQRSCMSRTRITRPFKAISLAWVPAMLTAVGNVPGRRPDRRLFRDIP